jgi:hypothetical protein
LRLVRRKCRAPPPTDRDVETTVAQGRQAQTRDYKDFKY